VVQTAMLIQGYFLKVPAELLYVVVDQVLTTV
jgi:hypothetical protein